MFPFDVRCHGLASGIARRSEAEAFHDQSAGDRVKFAVAAGPDDPAGGRAALGTYRDIGHSGATDIRLARRLRVIFVADFAAGPFGIRTTPVAVAIAVSGTSTAIA